HKLENDVIFFGRPDKKTLVQIYNLADVLVAPSLFEGFGMTILEAMACGTPTVTSKVSSMPEVVGDAGLCVDPESPQEIADAIYSLYENPVAYKTLVVRGLNRVKSFTWEKTAEQVAMVYEKLMKEKPTC
ncbi:MAG TPA: glycosyltransferase, partial [Stenomitos sp.]